ncbi:putative gustatory receptor 59c [Stomoxys calcitrans]|uniref:putative gustatory receptor 59c n=1 Tax=Stomoxys calcitrans TaxID=35570 RepID=UPI0027E35C0F|nr:putative gustatory receptor 59c [Stomoxys calcitrans]
MVSINSTLTTLAIVISDCLDHMRRSTQWMIRASYITSVLFGVTSLCYVENTGEVYTKPLVTIYSALANMAMLALVPHFLHLDYNAHSLPVLTNSLIFVLKAVGSIITVIINWTNREVFVKTLNDLASIRCKFMRRWPLSDKIKEKFETILRRKLLLGFITLAAIMLSSIEYIQTQLKIESFYAILPAIMVNCIINMVIMNYFLCITHLNVLLWAINEELEKILKSTYQLWHLRIMGQIGLGTWITQCCRLSDNLDELAVAQHHLHLLGNRINRMYDTQTACVLVMVYLNNLSMIYMSYPTTQKAKLFDEFSSWALVVMPILMILYYIDLVFFVRGMIEFEESFIATSKLLRERKLLYPALDVRLEESVSTRFPYKFIELKYI